MFFPFPRSVGLGGDLVDEFRPGVGERVFPEFSIGNRGVGDNFLCGWPGGFSIVLLFVFPFSLYWEEKGGGGIPLSGGAPLVHNVLFGANCEMGLSPYLGCKFLGFRSQDV